MRLNEFTSSPPDQPVTQQDLQQLEKYLDALYGQYGIDFEFTRHFLDRVNDPRNQKQITTGELFRLFGLMSKQYGQEIQDEMKFGELQAVAKDTATKVNSPFVAYYNKKTRQFELYAKTVMRKDKFQTRNKEFKI